MNLRDPEKATSRIRAVAKAACRYVHALPYALGLIWRFQKRLLIVLAASTVVNGISPVASVWLMRYFLDAVIAAYDHPGQLRFLVRALEFCALQVAVGAGFAAADKLISLVRTTLASRLSLDMHGDVIDGMARLPMKDYDNPQTYDTIMRAKAEAEGNKPLTIVTGACDILSGTITWLSLSSILFHFSPVVVAATALICVPHLLAGAYISKAHFDLECARTERARFAAYLLSCLANRRVLPEIITLDLWSLLRDKWTRVAGELVAKDLDLSKTKAAVEVGVVLVTLVGRGCVSLYIVAKCVARSTGCTVGQLTMYLQAFWGASNTLVQVMHHISRIYEGACFLDMYREFERSRSSPRLSRLPLRPPPNEIERIELRGVSFSYPGASRPVVVDVNLVLERGQRTMLVGRNGAGKSTLARLVVGLYVPTHGQVLVNGCDILEYDAGLLRKKVSMLFQDYSRFAFTARDNISLGDVDHMVDKERTTAAADAAGVAGVIGRLPCGYDTVLATEYQGGHDLSLGEWQRIGLARLFVRKPCVMVYDEPSSSLDVETECELLRRVRDFSKDTICLLISHRMLRADAADRVVLMGEGRILEQGDHGQLLSLGGQYARLWAMYRGPGGNGKTEPSREVAGLRHEDGRAR